MPYGVGILIASIASSVIGIMILSLLINLAALALLPIGVRRVHDGGKSGWFILIPFYNLYLLFGVDGDQSDNEYGAPSGDEVPKPF